MIFASLEAVKLNNGLEHLSLQIRLIKLKILVCGSIGYGGLSEIREIQSLLRKEGFAVVDHLAEKGMDYSKIKDFRNRKVLAEKIVKHDLDFVRKSDVVVALLNRPSYGTAVEIFVAKKLGKKVVFLSEKQVPTPWPIAISDRIVKSKEELVLTLKELAKAINKNTSS